MPATGDSDGFPALRKGRLRASGRRHTLLLDDLDPLRGPAVAAVRGLMSHAGVTLRLLVASRSDAALGLPRLRIDGRLLEIRAADLAFTETEAEAMPRAGRLDLAATHLTRLLARTDRPTFATRSGAKGTSATCSWRPLIGSRASRSAPRQFFAPRDQAELGALLEKIRSLGFALIEVRRLRGASRQP